MTQASSAFGVALATAVVTTSYVTADQLPILLVTHERDEGGGSLWQFHCGNSDYSESVLQLVRLDEILQLDETLLEVANLPRGFRATRRKVGEPWAIEDDSTA